MRVGLYSSREYPMNRPSPASLILAGLLAASLGQPLEAAGSLDSKPASAITQQKNAEVLNVLPFSDRTDYESASRGLIAPFKGQIRDANGKVVWDIDAYRFLDADQTP